MARPAYMEIETVQAMIEARDKERAIKVLAAYHAARVRAKRHKKVDILLPFKRGWKDILRAEARARVAFIRTFYPEATGADLARARFYQSLLTGVAGGLATVALYALFIICFA